MPRKKTETSCCDNHHPSYERELPRLNRISGQVDGVKRMIESGRYCPDIIAQLRAIRAAVATIEGSILETHLDSCVTEAFESNNAKEKQQKIDELKTLYRRYNC